MADAATFDPAAFLDPGGAFLYQAQSAVGTAFAQNAAALAAQLAPPFNSVGMQVDEVLGQSPDAAQCPIDRRFWVDKRKVNNGRKGEQ